MAEQTNLDQICPYLGLADDRYSRFSYPEPLHRCFAANPAGRRTSAESSVRAETTIPLEHQTTFCLTQNHPACPRFVKPPAEEPDEEAFSPTGSSTFRPAPPVASEATSLKAKALDSSQEAAGFSLWRTILWGVAGLLVGLVVIFSLLYFSSLTFPARGRIPQGDVPVPQGDVPASGGVQGAEGQAAVAESSTPIPQGDVPVPQGDVPAPTLSETAAAPEAAQVALVEEPVRAATPVAAESPVSEDKIYTLSPPPAQVGWVTSGEERGNHFGDSYLYAGILEEQIHLGAFQFDLSDIPRGAPIYQASLQLTGLREDLLASQNDRPASASPVRVPGAWILRLLGAEIDPRWRRATFQDIFNAPVEQTLNPVLGEKALASGQSYVFELSAEQIKILETRIIKDEKPAVSFRLEGPLVGPDNLFAWDTGYGPQSQGNRVTLFLRVGSPPATPPPYDYIVVTSTPTPEIVITVAAMMLQMTAEATRIGTATPPPPNMVTATPFPSYLVIMATPTPGNEATAQFMAAVATANAITTGTPTPASSSAVTPTPTASATATPTYVIITSTPTPESVFAAATMALAETAQAQRAGPPTPLPQNWVTPIVVTSTPTPANAATVQALAALATAQALTTGAPTPTPNNVQTATPTPAFVLIEPIILPTPVPAPAQVFEAMPAELIGKIIFLSDREGAEGPRAYVFDLETGQLGRLTATWPYELALLRDAWSADLRFRTFTKNVIRYQEAASTTGESTESVREDVPAIFWYDALYNAEEQVTYFGAGIAYGGAWSPAREQIAFVSNESADDEIWIVNRDGSNLQQLTTDNREFNAREIGKDTFIPEINKHPSFSPDGEQIVFFSTRSGNRQLWIMNIGGSEQRLLMDWTPYNDWDPVWIKYADLAPPLN